MSTVAQQAQQPGRVAPAPQTTPTAQTPAATKSADIPIATDIPEPTTPRDQEIYNKVQSLEKELKDKINSVASWNAIAANDPQSNNELVALRKEVDRTRKELQRQITKLTKANKEPSMARPTPQTTALPDPNVVDVDAWEIPDMDTAQELQPIAARENTEKPTAIGQMAKNVGQGQELQRDPAYRSQVRRTQQQVAQRQQTIAQQKTGYGNDADEFVDIPEINEGAMKEIDIMRQDLERMNDRQFYTAYGISKAAFQQKYRTLLKPALDEHGGGIGPKQHWQDLMQERKLSVGDPVMVTAPNEFEGKTGEIHELSPSGKFVIVNLYNHGKHSMHLSDVEYNQYADDQEQDDWYDEGLAESNVNPQFINSQVTKLLARATQTGNFDPLPQLLAPLMKQYNLTLQQIDTMVSGGLKKAAGEYGVAMKEGWSDAVVARRTGTPRTPYSVYINGKKWKDFENDDHARAVMDKLKAKFEADGRDPSVITIAPTDMSEDAATPPPEAPRPAIIAPAPAAKYMVKKPQAPQAQADEPAPRYSKTSPYSDDESTLKVYKPEQYRDVNEAGDRVDPILIKALNRMPDGLNSHGQVLNAAYDAYAMELGRMQMKSNYGTTNAYIPQLIDLYKDKYGLDIKETKADPTGSWVVYGGNKVIKFKTHTGAKAYAAKNGGKVASSEFYADRIQGVAETALNPRDPAGDYAAKRKALQDLGMNKAVDQAAVLQRRLDLDREARAKGITEGVMSNLHAELSDVYNRIAPGIERNRDSFKAGQLYDALEAVAEQHGAEAEFKRMMSGARNRAHMDYDTNPGGFQNWFWYLPFAEEELSEEQDTSGVERAILNRIMVAHTDLLMKFGPDKVMQAAEEVAYNVGDVDEIGTSDVSAYVHQVKQILGVPEELDEKWSQKYKSSINCANPKGFSQKAHCASKKK